MPLRHNRSLPTEPFGQPDRTGRFWFDLLASTAAIFISVVSLVVAFRGERTQRGLLAANSWPFVQLSEDQDATSVKLDVENAGVGPAKVVTFEVAYNGTPVDSAADLMHRCCGGPAGLPGTHAPLVHGLGYGQVFGNVLRPGEHIVALHLSKDAPPDMLARFKTVLANDALRYRSCYCSVLQECWISDLRSLAQTPLSACPAVPHPFASGF